MTSEQQAFAELGPDAVLDAIDGVGLRTSGHLLALNSYENRVYQIGIEDDRPVVAKFYRPGRWSDEAILEEHEFATELAELEIPVIAPLAGADCNTLYHFGPYRFALFPRCSGRAPELDNAEHLKQLGRFIGRLHNLGASHAFRHRPTLDIEGFGVASYQYLLEHGFVPMELETAYRSLAEDLIVRIRNCYQRAGRINYLRLHGDCHPGNILWRDEGPHIVDLDDARMGPAVQDLWMFLSGDRHYMSERLADVLEGYTLFRDFDVRELNLVEALRSLRMMHFAAWLAQRWDDPAFPPAFPWFDSGRFWDEHILALREQCALLDEPPLSWS